MRNLDEVAYATTKVNRRIGFYIHLAVFVIVNTLLVAVNLVTSAQHLWFVWPLMGWGLGIAVHALLIFTMPGMTDMRRRMIQKELRRNTSDSRSFT
jgi:hypothetical protein